MNRRITLESVAARISARIDQLLGVVKIGTALDSDFLLNVGKPASWPAVWVGAQRSNPIDPGTGFSGRVRQEVRTEIVVRVIVAKVVAGETSQEQRLNDIADGVADVLIGWTPGNGHTPLVWVSSTDGPAEQSVQTVDLVFASTVTYQYQHAA
jgi:hypothetical protein